MQRVREGGERAAQWVGWAREVGGTGLDGILFPIPGPVVPP